MLRLDAHRDQAGAWELMCSMHGLMAFDIGANIGVTARALAANFHRVIALEPCAESFGILLLESPPNVMPIMAAVSAVAGSVELTESADSIRSGQLTTGSALSWGAVLGTRSVDSVTVDDLVLHYGQPDFVKIDTEGHEVAVLQGWTGSKCAVLIEVHRADNEADVRDLFGAPLRKLTHDLSVHEHTRMNHFWLSNVA